MLKLVFPIINQRSFWVRASFFSFGQSDWSIACEVGNETNFTAVFKHFLADVFGFVWVRLSVRFRNLWALFLQRIVV